MSARLLYEVEHAAHLLMEEATVYAPQIQPYLIEVAGRQRMLQQQIAKEAHVIRNYEKFGEDNTHDWEELYGTIALWKDTHWHILKGYPAKDIAPATSLCVIWALKYAKDDFDYVEKDALAVASANDEEANKMIQHLSDVLPRGFVSMNKVVKYFEVSESEMESKCASETTWTISDDNWKAVILEVSNAAALAQKLVSEALLSKSGRSMSAHRRLAGAAASPAPAATSAVPLSTLETLIEEMTISVDMVKFGGGIVPAPKDNSFLQYASQLHASWHPFELALKGLGMEAEESSSSDRRRRAERRLAGAAPAPSTETIVPATVPEVLTVEEATSAKSESLLGKLVQASKLGVPAERMQVVSRQRMLVNKIVKEALLLKYGHSGSNFDPLNFAIGEFMSLAKTLIDGDGGDIPALIKQRDDLKNAIEATEGVFAGFEAKIKVLADSSAQTTAGLEDVQESVEIVEKQLEALSKVCEEEDPAVPDSFPWTQLIYLGMVLPACLLVGCSGVYKGWVPRK
jgi:hypothetical protein